MIDIKMRYMQTVKVEVHGEADEVFAELGVMLEELAGALPEDFWNGVLKAHSKIMAQKRSEEKANE